MGHPTLPNDEGCFKYQESHITKVMVPTTDDSECDILKEEFQTPALSYSFCYDNVQKMSVARHQGTQKNEMHMWTMCYAVLDRIATTHDADNSNVRSAVDIPVAHFLPSTDEWQNIRMRMTSIVASIIQQYIPAYNTADPVEPIRHAESENSAYKSSFVNLGVIHENPSTIAGTIEVLSQLSQHAPAISETAVDALICHGDQLSIERIVDAKELRGHALHPKDRLQFEPLPQEFHKRAIVLQDVMTDFFSASSAKQPGTLYHAKQVLGHKSLSGKVMANFHNVADFLKIVTCGMVVLYATKVLESCTQSSTGLLALASQVVNEIWLPPQPATTSAVVSESDDEDDDEDEEDIYCFCKRGCNGEAMVECSSGKKCPNGRWFHNDCIDVVDDDQFIDRDFHCSEGCRRLAISIFCSCKTLAPGQKMKRCANKACKGGVWFHISCVEEGNPSSGKWFCCVCRPLMLKRSSAASEGLDHVREYSMDVLWHGLLDLCQKDAVRRNDGPAMIQHWKMNMVQFMQHNHYKYMIMGHRLIAATEGCLPEHLRNSAIWNRTGNLAGRADSNLGLDYVNELLNRDFKANLAESAGQYTNENVSRLSKLVGVTGTGCDRLYQQNVSQTYSYASTSKDETHSSQVLKYISTYSQAELFDYTPGRQHKSFPAHVRHSTYDSVQFGAKIRQYGVKYDQLRRYAPK